MDGREYVVRDNPDERRYELLCDGELVGEILYRVEPGAIVLLHTDVAPSAEGQGLGGRLVAGALADIRSRAPGRSGVPVRRRVHQAASGAERPRRARPRALPMSSRSPEQERGPRRVYANEAIEVHWEPSLCIHVRNCVRGLSGVFDPSRRPWVDVDAGEPDAIAATILTCPTGALHFRRLDGGAQEEPAPETTIEPRPDGPLFIRGRVRIVGEDGRLLREDTRVALCRCGASENKPFCDGSHK
jgi:uncharacterized Fe-S cluster protein YjdI/predicted GNAT family acetyltransferase